MTALQNKDIAGYDNAQYTLHVEQILFLLDITWIKLRLRMTHIVMQYFFFQGKTVRLKLCVVKQMISFLPVNSCSHILIFSQIL